MKTDLVFNPAAADEARRNKALPAPTEHRVSPPSPAGQGPLDPTYAITTDRSGPFDAVAADRERRESRREYAVASRTENAAELAYRWAAPLEMVKRLLAAEAEIYILNSQISSLMVRLSRLESKSK